MGSEKPDTTSNWDKAGEIIGYVALFVLTVATIGMAASAANRRNQDDDEYESDDHLISQRGVSPKNNSSMISYHNSASRKKSDPEDEGLCPHGYSNPNVDCPMCYDAPDDDD